MNNWWRKPFAFHMWKWYNWLALFCTLTAIDLVMCMVTGLLFHNMHPLLDLVRSAVSAAAMLTLGYYLFRNRLRRP